ncbi:MAG: glycosyl hydrolase [[Eubacterium] siraeum]
MPVIWRPCTKRRAAGFWWGAKGSDAYKNCGNTL